MGEADGDGVEEHVVRDESHEETSGGANLVDAV